MGKVTQQPSFPTVATTQPAAGGRLALAVIEPSTYAILDPQSNVSCMVSENLSGESVSEFDLDRVACPAGGGLQWTVPSLSGEENVDAIEGIIVHVAKRRQFWADKNPSGNPPDCHSRDTIRGVGTPGGDCEACPHNQFGSAENGRGKLCKESREVFLCRPGDNLPIVIHVPAASIGNLKKYMMRLPSIPYFQAVTRFKLAREKNADNIAYSEIKPEIVAVLPPEAIGRIREYAVSLQKVFG